MIFISDWMDSLLHCTQMSKSISMNNNNMHIQGELQYMSLESQTSDKDIIILILTSIFTKPLHLEWDKETIGWAPTKRIKIWCFGKIWIVWLSREEPKIIVCQSKSGSLTVVTEIMRTSLLFLSYLPFLCFC